MAKEKPVVTYSAADESYIKVGLPAFVTPLNHPSPFVSNTQLVRTSPVISYDEKSGTFETQNTIYKLEKVTTL